MGGNWSSFRHIGQSAVEAIISRGPKMAPEARLDLKYLESKTLNFKLIGGYARSEFEMGK